MGFILDLQQRSDKMLERAGWTSPKNQVVEDSGIASSPVANYLTNCEGIQDHHMEVPEPVVATFLAANTKNGEEMDLTRQT